MEFETSKKDIEVENVTTHFQNILKDCSDCNKDLLFYILLLNKKIEGR